MTEKPDPEAGFLEQLGQRVRTTRALRGMSRKVLAKVSGISERYIAQLESGKGNVSIVLLRRVSRLPGDSVQARESGPEQRLAFCIDRSTLFGADHEWLHTLAADAAFVGEGVPIQ